MGRIDIVAFGTRHKRRSTLANLNPLRMLFVRLFVWFRTEDSYSKIDSPVGSKFLACE